MNLDNFQIKEGISENQIDQLIEFSKSDPEIIKNTHDSSRFKDRNSFDEWISKGKQIFTLTQNGDLKGIVWFSKKFIMLDKFKDYGISFAIRIYDDARGKGLSKTFAQKSIELLKNTDFYKLQNNKGIWLATNHENEIARRVYGNLGFEKIREEDKRITMIFPL